MTKLIACGDIRADPDGPAVRLVFAGFGLFGLVAGLWNVVLPDLQAALHLTPGALGTALTSGMLASFPMMLAGGRLADRLGARVLMAAMALLMASALVGFALVNQYWVCVVLLMAFFGGLGALDVAVNTAAIGVEQVTGRRIMTFFHAAWSGLAALSALVTGLLLWAGTPFRYIYLGGALALVVLAVLAWRGGPLPRPASRRLPPVAGGPQPRPARIPGIVYLLAGIAALSLLSEGSLETWSAIYLRSALGLPVLLGAAGPAVYHSAMLAGRLSSGRLIGRVGRQGLLLRAGGLAAVGIGLALLTTVPPVILAGLLLSGFALAGVVPVAFSLAGDQAPGRAGAASATITTVGYTGLLVGPILVGTVADQIGLRLALGILILAGLVIAGLSLRLGNVGGPGLRWQSAGLTRAGILSSGQRLSTEY